ncbi:hypothetical protein [Oceaniglobus indicus]|uniref:hypothetical protein n=1 Tax=Oceaniglobus indicus TaxID=2047749 RepID=UPI0011AB2DCE|nr:hypothetical protein [Oceaniglobus indicus]
MNAKTKKQTAPLPLTKAQQDRIKAVAEKQAARADGPPMTLILKDDVLQITFTQAEPDLANILMMAGLATCDPSFMAGVQGQVAANCLLPVLTIRRN